MKFVNYLLVLASVAACSVAWGQQRSLSAIVTGNQITDTGMVSIVLASLGDENIVTYSVSFDPAVLQYVSKTDGVDLPPEKSVQINATQAASGRIGVINGLTPPTVYTAGNRQILVLNFKVIAASATTTAIVFSDNPTARSAGDAVGNDLSFSVFNGAAISALPLPKQDQTIAFGPLAARTFGSAAFALSATASPSGLPVSFGSSNTSVATVDGSTVTIVGAGSTVITASQAGDGTYNPASSVPQSLGVNKATASVGFSGVNPITAFTVPAGLPVVITYNGGSTPPTQAGSYEVVGTINHPNYAGSSTTTLVVAKTNQTITLQPIPSKKFGDPPFTIDATASSSLPVTVTSSNPEVVSISGNTATINGAGTTTLSANAAGDANFNAALTVSQLLPINKGTASLTLTNLAAIYNGSPRAAGATTNPAGLSVVITYDGNASPPANAGSYAVVGTISDANYLGSASGTLVIAKATPTITWASPASIEFGTALSALQLNATSGGIAGGFVYSPVGGTVLDVGANQTLAVNFTPNDSSNYNSATGNTTITVREVSAPFPPTNVSASDSLTDRIVVSWTAVSGATGYDVYRATTDNSSAAVKLNSASVVGVSYDDSTAGIGVVYYYFVKSRNGTVESISFSVGDAGQRTPLDAPVITVPPVSRVVRLGGSTTFAATATGSPPLNYQWSLNGAPLAGANAATYVIESAQYAHAGTYTVAVSNLQQPPASAIAQLSVVDAKHSATIGGYAAGGTISVTVRVVFAGPAVSLALDALLPDGWSYAGGTGEPEGNAPVLGTTGVLGWSWTTVPASPVEFSYRLSVPAGEAGSRSIRGRLILRHASGVGEVLMLPDPLVLSNYHSADTSNGATPRGLSDFQIDLFELTRVIELYNTRKGTVRTGCYQVDPTGEDGFGADASRNEGTTATLARYHSADTRGATTGTPRDGAIDLFELTRVIELYNYRVGTVRTGEYHVHSGSEDGFAPGPISGHPDK